MAAVLSSESPGVASGSLKLTASGWRSATAKTRTAVMRLEH